MPSTSKVNLGPRRTKGFIYGIVHPAHEGCVKVGRTTNLKRRLRQYQTACPYRSFSIAFAFESDDVEWDEILARDALEKHHLNGEWFALPANLALLKIARSVKGLRLYEEGGG